MFSKCSWFSPKQTSKLVYIFGSFSFKPMQGNGVVYLTMLAPHCHCNTRAFLCCNWDLAFSSANTSYFERLVPIFMSHVLGIIGYSSTNFFLLPLTKRLNLVIVEAKPKLILHIVGGPDLLQHYACWSKRTMLVGTDFCMARCTRSCLHCPTSLDWGKGNLAMCH